MQDGRLWSAKDIAEDLRVSRGYVYALFESGQLAPVSLPNTDRKSLSRAGRPRQLLRVPDSKYRAWKEAAGLI